MKKFAFIAICALAVMATTGCKNKAKSPGEAAKTIHEAIQNDDYDTYVEHIFYEPATPVEVVKQDKVQNAAILKKTVKPAIQSKGGVKEVKVASENILPDGKSADVILNKVYNNGETEDVLYSMILDADNEWKVHVHGDRAVWRSHTPDGKREVVKLIDGENREILKTNFEGEHDFVKEIDGDNREVIKIKEDGEKDVLKVIEKEDEIVIKEKADGEKDVTRIPK